MKRGQNGFFKKEEAKMDKKEDLFEIERILINLAGGDKEKYQKLQKIVSKAVQEKKKGGEDVLVGNQKRTNEVKKKRQRDRKAS